MPRAYAHYQVSLKLLLKRGRSVLLLRLTSNNCWDLPGGRIDAVEGRTPLEKILAREIREELGPTLRYQLGQPLFQFRRWVPVFHTYNFLTVYAGKYLRGDVRLSPEHRSWQWLNPRQHRFRLRDFMSQEEYRAFLRYFGRQP